MEIKSIIVIAMLACQGVAYAQTGSVILIVEGIDVDKGGRLYAGIFQEGHFPNVGEQLIGKEVPAEAGSVQITFTQIPVGAYGIAVFQDTDLDKVLKTNFVGLPREPIGFSNDARIRFGPPSFDEAKFLIENNKEIKLKIILR
jgi:uncharacterized protein (DUF2141 family)